MASTDPDDGPDRAQTVEACATSRFSEVGVDPTSPGDAAAGGIVGVHFDERRFVPAPERDAAALGAVDVELEIIRSAPAPPPVVPDVASPLDGAAAGNGAAPLEVTAPLDLPAPPGDVAPVPGGSPDRCRARYVEQGHSPELRGSTRTPTNVTAVLFLMGSSH